MGRPAIVREDSTIHNCRLLLDHPLALDSDVRLVYAVELIALRAPLHVELTATPDLPLDAATLARLRWANEQFDAWEKHWADELVARYGPSGFVHESLAMQRQLAELFINSQLLRGVRSAEDVKAMSADKRALALRAMHNALKCGEIARKGVYVSCPVQRVSADISTTTAFLTARTIRTYVPPLPHRSSSASRACSQRNWTRRQWQRTSKASRTCSPEVS